MAAKKKAAPKTTKSPAAKKAAKTKTTGAAKRNKGKTSSKPGESAKAHEWLMQSQGVNTKGLPQENDAELDAMMMAEDQGSQEAIAEAVAGFVNETETDARPRFVKGGKPGPGRPKGSRNKFAEEFITDFYNDWLEHGPTVLAVVRAEKPDQYLKVAAAILPKQMDVRVSEFAELTEDALDKKISELSSQLGAAMAFLKPEGAMQ